MRKFCLIVLGCALLTAQEHKQNPMVRSITVRLISARAMAPKSIDFTAITAAWKTRQVPLAVEQPLNVKSIETAKEVIREMYSKTGRVVKVDHRMSQIPPRSLEVAFEVVELCPE
jgi:hypothetical protein